MIDIAMAGPRLFSERADMKRTISWGTPMNGKPTARKLNIPTSAAVDGAGRLFVAGTGRERNIQFRAGRSAFPGLRRRAGAGIEGMLVGADVDHVGAPLEDVLGAVAVVDVVVENRDPLEPVVVDQGLGGDGGVVQVAELRFQVGVVTGTVRTGDPQAMLEQVLDDGPSSMYTDMSQLLLARAQVEQGELDKAAAALTASQKTLDSAQAAADAANGDKAKSDEKLAAAKAAAQAAVREFQSAQSASQKLAAELAALEDPPADKVEAAKAAERRVAELEQKQAASETAMNAAQSAADQAALDLVNQAPPLYPSALPKDVKAGDDKFRAVYPDIDGTHALRGYRNALN